MFIDLVDRISTETNLIKSTVADTLRSKRPNDTGLFFVVSLKTIAENNFILSATYYNTYRQLTSLAEYVESGDRSLGAILNTFQTIADKGRAGAFKDEIFNRETRAIVASIL